MLLLFELDYLIQYFCWLKPGDNIMVMKTKANEKYTCVLPDNPDAKEEVNFIYSIRFHCNTGLPSYISALNFTAQMT